MLGWLFGKNKDMPPTEDISSAEEQTLSDIVRGISHAVTSVSDVQDNRFVSSLKMYFDVGDDGIFYPKMVLFDNGGNKLQVPLISLINPSSLRMDEIKVRVGVRLSASKVKKVLDSDSTRSSFSVALTGCKPGSRKDVIDVTMTFKNTDPSEGISRIIEEINQKIGYMSPNPSPEPDKDQVLDDKENFIITDDPDDNSTRIMEARND